MKSKFRLFTLVLTVLFTFSVLWLPSFAECESYDNISVIKKVKRAVDKLMSEQSESGIILTIDKSITDKQNINKYLSMSEEEIITELRTFVEDAKNIVIKPVEKKNNSTRDSGIDNVSVWCGIPAIGWGYINIQFSYTTGTSGAGNTIFTSGSVSNSWLSGITIASWTHQYGDFDITSYGLYADVTATGTLSYTIGGIGFHIPDQTFLASISASDY